MACEVARGWISHPAQQISGCDAHLAAREVAVGAGSHAQLSQFLGCDASIMVCEVVWGRISHPAQPIFGVQRRYYGE